ncbi:MAG: RNA polymerase sigma factor [Acidobacteriota bacterium]
MESSELQAQLERYHQGSYTWALSCCFQDSFEAENILQSVYLKILEGKAKYSGQSSFKTWLFAVIRKTAIDKRRWNLRYKLGLSKYQERVQSNIGESPDEIVYRGQIKRLFEQALACLSDKQQEVLQLVFYHDLSLQEASEVMNISLGSARTHYERGKKQLYKLLEELKVFDESRSSRKDNQEIIPGAKAE